jgi:hypothetical protein
MSIVRYAPSSFVSMAELDGEMVLLDSQSGKYFGLDKVASSIWNNVSRGLTQAEVVDALLADYDVSFARAQQDVARLLSFFVDRQLVVASGAPAVEQPV